jgi:hypothetical protein
MGELRITQTNTLELGVISDIEALVESHADDGIQTVSGGRHKITNDEVNGVVLPVNVVVELVRPDLRIRSEFKTCVSNLEPERLEVFALFRGDAEETRLWIKNCTSRVLVAFKCI